MPPAILTVPEITKVLVDVFTIPSPIWPAVQDILYESDDPVKVNCIGSIGNELSHIVWFKFAAFDLLIYWPGVIVIVPVTTPPLLGSAKHSSPCAVIT